MLPFLLLPAREPLPGVELAVGQALALVEEAVVGDEALLFALVVDVVVERHLLLLHQHQTRPLGRLRDGGLRAGHGATGDEGEHPGKAGS